MAKKTFTLTDRAHDVYLDQFDIGPEDVPGKATGWRVSKKRLRGGLSDGVDLVNVNYGDFGYAVLPTRGMNIWSAWSGDFSLGWTSPVKGPVHPAFVPLMEPGGLGWLDGFDELLVRCGLESNGAPDFDDDGRLKYPLHGRIGNLPAQRVEVTVDGDTGEISVTGVVAECRFHFQKLELTATVTTRPGEKRLEISDTVKNLSASPGTMQMLYHANFGAPLLDPGSRLVAPVRQLVPRNPHAAAGVANWADYPAGQPGSEELVYFFELAADKQGRTRVPLKSAHGTYGVGLEWDAGPLPCFTQWKNVTALEDGYVTGLEPGTNFPNPRSFETEQDRVVQLAPGGTQQFALAIELFADADAVTAAEREVQALQQGVEPVIHDGPQPKWCAP